MPHRGSGRNKVRKLPPLDGKAFELRGRIWLDGKEGTFLGHGRVALMEKIIELGSITKAAKSMGMSYRHAWRLIDSMNRQSPFPFVVTATGGKKGGGTVVTEHGERAMEVFRSLNEEFLEFLAAKTSTISFEKEKEEIS
jgi:molybdate transport system regulatory protein